MIHLIISISLKGWYFSGDIQSFTFFRLYKYIQSVFYCKTDFGFAATILITPLKIQTEAGFSFGNDSVSFFFCFRRAVTIKSIILGILWL
jgi:hypothetical protein